jgi:capsular exopolysaccharide synthesis family protein
MRGVIMNCPANGAAEKEIVDLSDYLLILRKSWILIISVTVAGVLAAGVASLATVPTYASTTRVFVAIQTSDVNSADLSAGTTYVRSQVKSFAEVATTDKVLGPVIDELDLKTTVANLAGKVTATAPVDTVIIEISVEDLSATRAADIANAVGRNLIDAVEQLSKPTDAASPVKMSTVSPALPASQSTSPNVRLNLLLGLLAGVALGLGAAILREVLDTRIHTAREIAQITDATILGGITFDTEAVERPLVVQVSPQSPRAEAFRQLRTNLQFVEVDDTGRTFVITSSLQSEGKSSTSANLAITLAEAGSRVLLIDGDLRRPRVAEYMGLEGAVGLTDHLIGNVKLDDVVQSWGSGNLEVLPAGQVPPNPSELLGSKAMIALLARLDAEYDTVIIDAPPLLPVTDAAILSKLVSGGAIMVVGSGKTTKHQAETAISTIETVGGRLVGVILNLLPIKGANAYSYYGYYSDVEAKTKPKSTSRRLAKSKTTGQ